MTFVGVRIENGELEVGFKAATRSEYEENQRLVAAAAGLHWPPGAAEPDLSRDPAEPPQDGDFVESAPVEFSPLGHAGGDYRHTRSANRRAEQQWLRRQGLLGADDEAVS